MNISSPYRKKILFITAFHPGGMGHIGAGEAISEQHLKDFINSGHDVHALCLAPNYQSSSHNVVSLCSSYKLIPHRPMNAIKSVLKNFKKGSIIAPWFFTRVSSENINNVNQYISEHKIDHVHLDFPSCLGFSKYIENASISYSVHDVVSQKISRTIFFKFLGPLVARIESGLLENIKKCLVISEKDAFLCQELNPNLEKKVIKPLNLTMGNVKQGKPVSEVIEQFQGYENLVFFGNMRRQENNLSIIRFLIWDYPFILLKNRNIRFWVLGLSPRLSLKLLGLFLPGVKVVGPVDDPREAFIASTICIAPLYFGAGVKIKVIHMLEVGAKVIATPIGAEGINSHPNLKVIENNYFAKAVNDCLGHLSE